MKFVLIVIVWTYAGTGVSTSVAMGEFNNLKACEIAMNQVRTSTNRHEGVTSFCVAKGTEKEKR